MALGKDVIHEVSFGLLVAPTKDLVFRSISTSDLLSSGVIKGMTDIILMLMHL